MNETAEIRSLSEKEGYRYERDNIPSSVGGKHPDIPYHTSASGGGRTAPVAETYSSSSFYDYPMHDEVSYPDIDKPKPAPPKKKKRKALTMDSLMKISKSAQRKMKK